MTSGGSVLRRQAAEVYMFLNIRDMEVRPIVFDLTYPPGEIDYLEDGLRQRTDLHVDGRADLLGSVDEIRVRGKLTIEMEAACERCLESAIFPIAREFDLFYRPADGAEGRGELALREGEVELAFYEGDGLDLKEVLREQVLLALPMQKLCREGCKGLCPICGANRNQSPCSCVAEIVDERWAALRKLSAK